MTEQNDQIIKESNWRARLSDLSLWGVFMGNMLSIIMAYVQGWSLSQMMWVFWAQSVFIGAINVVRMLSLKEFSTDGVKVNGRRPSVSVGTKYQMATFFAFHYGFFHFGYFFFLWEQGPLTSFDPMTLILGGFCALGLFGAHSFSFVHNLSRDFRHKAPNIGTIMMYPYLRIIPLHITIIFGSGFGAPATLLFLILKTAADCGMHMVEHYLFQKPSKETL